MLDTGFLVGHSSAAVYLYICMLALYMYVSSITAHTAGPNWLKFLREFSKLFFWILFFYHTGHFSCFFIFTNNGSHQSLFFFRCPLFFLLEFVSVLVYNSSILQMYCTYSEFHLRRRQTSFGNVSNTTTFYI